MNWTKSAGGDHRADVEQGALVTAACSGGGNVEDERNENQRSQFISHV